MSRNVAKQMIKKATVVLIISIVIFFKSIFPIIEPNTADNIENIPKVKYCEKSIASKLDE